MKRTKQTPIDNFFKKPKIDQSLPAAITIKDQDINNNNDKSMPDQLSLSNPPSMPPSPSLQC